MGVNFEKFKGKHFLEIDTNETLQEVYDRIYFLLEDYVGPYTYMETWILKEKITGTLLVVREVASLILAKHIFRPGFKWEAIKLDKPYNAIDSNQDRDRWFYLGLVES